MVADPIAGGVYARFAERRSSPSFALGGINYDVEEKTFTLPPWGWSCFHCNDHFPATEAGARAARRHFGAKPTDPPACFEAR